MSTPWPAVVSVGLLGLMIGSFLNVVIHRVPREQSILFPGSRCPTCDEPIKPWHNVPVFSWLALRGRCARCRAPISVRYPLVEASTGALFAAITLRFGLSAQLPAYLYLAAIGVALAAIDFDVHRLPNAIVLPSYAVGVLLLMPAGAADGDWFGASRALAGMLGMFAVYLLLAMAYPGGMGFGDVKLAGLLGLFLGYLSWGAVLVGAFGGFLLGGVGGGILLACGRAGRKSAIAFGPCMIAAAVLALFVATPITTWYTSLLSVA
jgi:leader peptidase (prepilin peptidase)/N-methyltransferase